MGRTGGSFRFRVFLALLAMALLPTVLVLVTGTVAVRRVMSGAGTAGPWSEVAESGRVLLARVESAAPEDTLLLQAAADHREALSESLRFSRVYALVAERFVALLPAVAAILALLATVPALLLARTLSRSLAAPVRELAGWTDRIARSEPLPPPEAERGVASVEELGTLRGALRRMEAELGRARRSEVESARLRSWTEMARRVAHELKNPLTPMRMAALALARRNDPSTAAESEVLLEEIDRLDELARSFAQFGHMPEGPVSEVDLEELLEGIARRHTTIELPVRVDVAPGTPRIPGRYEALSRVFRNLVVNAVEAAATPGGAGRTPDEGGDTLGGGEGASVLVSLDPAGDGVRVRVVDTGPGIPEDLLHRIWTPDFTTKRRGSGIGLALVQQTVAAHMGTVTVENAAGGGAVFTVWLPAHTADGDNGSPAERG